MYILLLVGVVIAGPSLLRMGIVPGPEGLNLKLYGVQFAEYSNTLWKLGEIGNNEVLESQTTTEFFWPHQYLTSTIEIKCTFPDPYNTVFKKDLKVEAAAWPLFSEADYYTTLQVERERPTIPQVNIHGDPLGADVSPTAIRYIEYHTPRITEGNQISFKKYSIHVVPVDFVVQMSVRGDRWCGWSDTHLWFMLQTNVWRTAFTESQVEQIQEWLDKNPPENATLSAYDYKGGFPIWAWIGEWDPLTWCDEEERETQPPQEAYDNVRIYPSLEGREITLYTEASYQYDMDLEAQENVADPETLQDILIGDIAALPDPNFATTVYTPIYIEKFYPYYQEGPWWNHWVDEWYPTTYMRVRLLYAIYGEFTYLWTVEEAEAQDYEWETRISQYKYEAGPWEFLAGVGSWFASPWGIGSIILILGGVMVALIVITNPGLLTALLGMRKRW